MPKPRQTTIVTFLGRPRHASDGQAGRYDKTRYRFEDGTEYETTFLPDALISNVRGGGGEVVIQRILIIGTASSAWDSMLEIDGLEVSDSTADVWQDLTEALEAKRPPTDDDLLAVSRCLGTHWGIEVDCRVVSFALKPEEQRELTEAIVEYVPKGQSLIVDITHGLRHMPLLALSSAFLLRGTRNVRIDRIIYGAYEARETPSSPSPVVELEVVRNLTNWSEAARLLVDTGRLYGMAEMARSEGHEDLGKSLARVDFLMTTNVFTAATKEAKTALSLLRDVHSTPGEPLALFAQLIRGELSWVVSESVADRQLALAKRAYENHDYLRVMTMLYEAMLNAVPGERNFESSKATLWEDYGADDRLRLIAMLRNASAHDLDMADTRKDPKVRKRAAGCLDDEARFRSTLQHKIFPFVESVIARYSSATRRASAAQSAESAKPATKAVSGWIPAEYTGTTPGGFHRFKAKWDEADTIILSLAVPSGDPLQDGEQVYLHLTGSADMADDCRRKIDGEPIGGLVE